MTPVERTEALRCDKHEFCLADSDLDSCGLTRYHEPTRQKDCARQMPDHAPPPIVEARNDTDRVCHIRCRPVDGVSLCQWSDAFDDGYDDVSILNRRSGSACSQLIFRRLRGNICARLADHGTEAHEHAYRIAGGTLIERKQGYGLGRLTLSGRDANGRGRDEDYSLPPAQIPACAANAPGSSLGFCRRSG